ncbi:MAG: DUF1592 domain-containing protein [Deltaproteobacteria bacterium]|nr:DUF1592 domain-containing protein [Deltaproteobacteria bacterium]
MRRRTLSRPAFVLSSALASLAAACAEPPAPQTSVDCPAGTETELAAEYATSVHPLLLRPVDQGGCVACHAPDSSRPFVVWPDADETFRQSRVRGLLDPTGERTLLAMLARSDGLRMPLAGQAWPEAERSAVERLVCRMAASDLPPASCSDADPGNVLLRRLSNDEYDRTAARSLGDATEPSSGLAADTPGHGFDNVASAQTLSIGHLERYLNVGARLARETLLVPSSVETNLEAESLSAYIYNGQKPGPGQGSVVGEHYHFQRIRSYLNGGLQHAPYAGTYTIEVKARGTSAPHYTCPEPNAYDLCVQHQAAHDGPWLLVENNVAPKLVVMVDGQLVGQGIDVASVAEPSQLGPFASYSVSVPLEPGFHSVRVWLDNVVYWAREERDVTLDVDRIRWTGPLPADLPPVDAARIARFLLCDSFACRDQAIANALAVLWRRPATSDEVARYAVLVDDAAAAGESFKDGLEAVLEAALASPNFLFRPELDPEPDVPASRPLDGYELATRLSYFVWGGPPDADLLAHAAAGDLVQDDVLGAELDRMLQDPRASAIVERFAAQWLQLESIESSSPSAGAFPNFSDALKASFMGELHAILVDALANERTVFELIDSPRVFVDARLAAHYGLDATGLGEAFVAVSPGASGRGGLLASAGVLMMTSHPSRTSPTKRGKWLLEQLLCRPPGAPPPNVDATFEGKDVANLSPKEMLEQHTTSPSCAGCHAQMDPLGFALEGFDAIGQARTTYATGEPVDDVASLPDGVTLNGLGDVVAYVKSDPGFPLCTARKMLTYALGTDPTRFDPCAVEAVTSGFADGGYTLKALVRAVAMGPTFRSRRPAKQGEYDDLFGGQP